MIPQDGTSARLRPSFARLDPVPRFLPHCSEPRIVAMGLSSMEGDWIDADGEADWAAYKRAMRQEYNEKVYAALPESSAAATEFATMVMSELGASEPLPLDEPLWHASLLVSDDLVVMLPDSDGAFRLSAASLCSPSDWRLEEKLGLTMSEVHGPIPRLNDEIGGQIDRFFARLPADRTVQRFNWSLTPHANFMSRDHWLLRPDSSSLWYRAERQSLRRLPETGAIAFTIRVHLCPLLALSTFDGALEDLWAAIAEAPSDLRHYKGLDILAPVIARWRSENQL